MVKYQVGTLLKWSTRGVYQYDFRLDSIVWSLSTAADGFFCKYCSRWFLLRQIWIPFSPFPYGICIKIYHETDWLPVCLIKCYFIVGEALFQPLLPPHLTIYCNVALMQSKRRKKLNIKLCFIYEIPHLTEQNFQVSRFWQSTQTYATKVSPHTFLPYKTCLSNINNQKFYNIINFI